MGAQFYDMSRSLAIIKAQDVQAKSSMFKGRAFHRSKFTLQFQFQRATYDADRHRHHIPQLNNYTTLVLKL